MARIILTSNISCKSALGRLWVRDHPGLETGCARFAHRTRLCADPGGLLERIPSPLTVARDLQNAGLHSGKRVIADKTPMAGGRHEG
jgi:hypothetical protein